MSEITVNSDAVQQILNDLTQIVELPAEYRYLLDRAIGKLELIKTVPFQKDRPSDVLAQAIITISGLCSASMDEDDTITAIEIIVDKALNYIRNRE